MSRLLGRWVALAATVVAVFGVSIPQELGAQGGEVKGEASKISLRSVLSPVDSLYRAARQAMVKGDDATSIRLFDQLSRRYPKSPQATSSLYYRAFLLYRQYQPGQPAPLRLALTSLQRLEREYPNAPQAADGRALQNRICGELGQLGDSACRKRVVSRARPSQVLAVTVTNAEDSGVKKGTEKNMQASGSVVIHLGPGISVERDTSCHNDKEVDSYVAALNSLWKVDSTRAMEAMGQILTNRDRCLTRLREQTLLIVMQRPTPVMAMSPVIFEVAQKDPDPNVKRLATMWFLSQEWDPPTAKFLQSIFGQTFREKSTAGDKTTAKAKEAVKE